MWPRPAQNKTHAPKLRKSTDGIHFHKRNWIMQMLIVFHHIYFWKSLEIPKKLLLLKGRGNI
jgi:hypothetical protein